jgi:hypothetical protein
MFRGHLDGCGKKIYSTIVMGKNDLLGRNASPMAINHLPKIAVDILANIVPSNGKVLWHIKKSVDGHVVEAAFRWEFSSPPRSDIIISQNRKSRRRKHKSPSQRRRDRRRLEALLAKKRPSCPTEAVIDIGNPIDLDPPPEGDVGNSIDLDPAPGGDVGATATGCTTSEHTECGTVVSVLSCENFNIPECAPNGDDVVVDIVVDSEPSLHTVPTLVQILPSLSQVEVTTLAETITDDNNRLIQEYKVTTNLLSCMNSQRGTERFHQLEQRARRLEQAAHASNIQCNLMRVCLSVHRLKALGQF